MSPTYPIALILKFSVSNSVTEISLHTISSKNRNATKNQKKNQKNQMQNERIDASFPTLCACSPFAFFSLLFSLLSSLLVLLSVSPFLYLPFSSPSSPVLSHLLKSEREIHPCTQTGGFQGRDLKIGAR